MMASLNQSGSDMILNFSREAARDAMPSYGDTVGRSSNFA